MFIKSYLIVKQTKPPTVQTFFRVIFNAILKLLLQSKLNNAVPQHQHNTIINLTSPEHSQATKIPHLTESGRESDLNNTNVSSNILL